MGDLVEGYMALSAFIASGYFLGRFIIRKVKHNMAVDAVVENTEEFDNKYSHLFKHHDISQTHHERKHHSPKKD